MGCSQPKLSRTAPRNILAFLKVELYTAFPWRDPDPPAASRPKGVKSLWWNRKHWEGKDRDDTLFLVGITMRIYFIKVDATYYVKTYNIERHGYPKIDSMTTQEKKDLSYFKGILLHNSYTMIVKKDKLGPDESLATWY